MKTKCGLIFALLALGALALNAAPAAAAPLEIEAGVFGGGGLTFAFGELVTKVQDDLVARGSAAGSPGTAVYEFTPSWMAGAYATLRLVDWFKLGIAPHLSYLGTTFLGSTDTGLPWARYSLAMPSVMVPVSARFALPFGGGELELFLGPELGILAGDPLVQEQAKNTTVSQSISPGKFDYLYLAANAGLAGRIKTALGWFSLGINYDMALVPLSPASKTGEPGFMGNPVFPVALDVYLAWGWPFSIGAKPASVQSREE